MANINIKLIMIFSLTAVILSIIAGGIGGVAFLEILIRSFFAGVIFGALGYGVGFIIDRFLPELSGSPMIPGEQKVKGSEIDEMIDSENPYETFQGGFESDLDSNEFEHATSKVNEESSDVPGSEGDNPEDLTNIEETAATEHSDNLSKNDYPDQPEVDSGLNNLVKEENSGPLINDVETIDSMGIDDMPSLDNFNGTFSTFNSESSKGTEIGSPTENKSSKMDVPEYLQDPGKSAQAIQTWLQRDKEG